MIARATLGSTAVIAIGLASSSAFAACGTTTPASGQTIDCSGTSTAAIVAGPGHDNVTVNLDTGAALNVSTGNAISLQADSAVNLGNSAELTTTGNGNAAIVFLGNNGALQMKDKARIATSGSGAWGVDIEADHGRIALGGTSYVTTTGANAQAINLSGNDNHLDIGQGATVSASGAGASAIILDGDNNVIVNHGTIASGANDPAILGDNNAANHETIFNFGKIVTDNGFAIKLQNGDDRLVLGTGSDIGGLAVDAGAGNDSLVLTGSGTEDDAFENFETLTMDGTDWSLTDASVSTTFDTIDIVHGRLGVDGGIIATTTTVGPAGTLGGQGLLVSDVTSTGTIAPANANTIGLLVIDGSLTQTGGAIDIKAGLHGVDQLLVDGPGTETIDLASGPQLNVSSMPGLTGGAGSVLHAKNGITGSFGKVNYVGNGAVDVIQTANDISIIAVDATPVVASAFAASQGGLDYLESLGDEQLAGLDICGTDACDRPLGRHMHLWAKGFGQFGREAESDGNRGFNYRIAGTALGGDMAVADGLRLGVSAAYANTEETVAHHAADADIDTTQAAIYADYRKGRYFITGSLAGGWQRFSLNRQIGADTTITFPDESFDPGSGQVEADATTHGWLLGGSMQVGAQFAFPTGWRLTPSVAVAYQHQWVGGYAEHGGGSAGVAINGHQADALRLKAQLVLAQDYVLAGYTITPHAKIGAQQQYNFGGNASGTFSDGAGFNLALADSRRTIGLAGIGVDLTFQNGLSTYVDYDGALAAGRTVQAVTGGLRYSW